MDPQINFQTIFHALPNAYLIVDPDLIIIDANTICLSSVKMTRDEVVGLSLIHLLQRHAAPASIGKLQDSYDEVLSTKAKVILPLLRHATERTTSAGTVNEDRYWSVTHVPVIDDDTSLRCIVTHMAEIAGHHLTPPNQFLERPDEQAHHSRFARTSPPAWIKLARGENHALSTASPSLRILLVEDNEDLKETTAIMIEALGHMVVAVDNAERALDMLATESFDVLFTDLSLPKASGAELARETLRGHPSMRVIITSGYGRSMDNARNLDAVFLPKPYQLVDIQIALDSTSLPNS